MQREELDPHLVRSAYEVDHLSLKAIGRVFRIGVPRVRELILLAGGEIRPHGGTRPGFIAVYEQIADQVEALYAAGRSKSQIGKTLHVSDTVVYQSMRFRGIEARPCGTPIGHRRIPIGEIRLVEYLKSSGMTHNQISDKTRLTNMQIRNRLAWSRKIKVLEMDEL